MPQTNPKYKRLEALFSETKPAQPDPHPKPVSGEVDALKARVSELEAMLGSQRPEPAADSPTAAPNVESAATPAVAVETARRTFPPAAITSGTPRLVRFPRLARLWTRLTGAHPSIQDVGERQQAQMAAALSFGLTILFILAVVMSTLVKRSISIQGVFLIGMTIITAGTYFASRSTYYKWGSAVLVIGLVAAGYSLAITNPGSVSSSLYSILPTALVLGSLLLPLPGLAALAGINFLIIGILLPRLVPGYTTGLVDGGIQFTIGALLIIAVAYRNSIERLHVAEVTTVNTELQAIRSSLEQRVEDRIHDLELAVDVGRTITEKVADLQEMLTSAVEMIRARFNLYYTQVYLTDAAGKTLGLRAGTGSVGQELLSRGHHLPVSSASLNGRAVMERKALIVADTTLSPTFLPNRLLPNTRSEMAIPLIASGQVIGVLDMQSDIPGALHESNLPAFEVLAGQLAVAIQNAGLFAQNQEARQQVEANMRHTTETGWQDFLNSIDHGERIGYHYDQNKTTALQEFGETSSQARLAVPITIMGAQIGKFETVEGDHNLTSQDVELIQATVARLGQHLESLRLLSQAEHYRADAEQAVRQLTHEGWDSYLKTREKTASGFVYDRNEVRLLDGQSLGNSIGALKRSLVVRDQTIGELEVEGDTHSAADVELIAAVAGQLSSYIENLRLSEQNEERAHEMETVAELSATTSTLLDPDRLLQTIVDLTKERFGVYHTHIYLLNQSLQTLNLAAGAGEIGRKLVTLGHAIALNAEKSLVARSARERLAVIVNDARADPAFLPNPLLPETRSEMAVPMIVGDKVLGVFDVQSDRVDGFSSEDASIYTTLASQVAVALQNAWLYVEQAATVTQLRELDRLKSAFLANMSHELRTPLNSILGFSDVMLEELDGPLTETMNNDLTLIQRNGQHLLHLINDVLDMAKIEAGRMNLAPERFGLHEVLDDVISITSTLASEKNLAVTIENESGQDIPIFADRTRLRQVMINLVNNSIKFTEKGQILIQTKLQEGEKVLIAVKDTGIGIPPDKLETIFQEFAQIDTSSTRKAGGTGLGLPISRRLVELHGGRLWAESTGNPGEGSTFYVELPLEARITESIEKLEK